MCLINLQKIKIFSNLSCLVTHTHTYSYSKPTVPSWHSPYSVRNIKLAIKANLSLCRRVLSVSSCYSVTWHDPKSKSVSSHNRRVNQQQQRKLNIYVYTGNPLSHKICYLHWQSHSCKFINYQELVKTPTSARQRAKCSKLVSCLASLVSSSLHCRLKIFYYLSPFEHSVFRHFRTKRLLTAGWCLSCLPTVASMFVNFAVLPNCTENTALSAPTHN